MEYKQEVVTPETAQMMLNKMGRNRTLSMQRVNKLAEDMTNGNFTSCPDPICFNTKGELSNGQHRLEAIIKSGKSVLLTIATDVPDDAEIDHGKERSICDSMYMRGLIDENVASTVHTATVKAYFASKYGDKKARLISENKMAEFITNNHDEIILAERISRAGHIKHPIGRRSSVRAAILGAILCNVNEEKLWRFMEVVNTGFSSGECEYAAVVLHNYLHTISGLTGSAINVKLTAFAENAISDFVAGVPRQRVYTSPKHIYIKSEEGSKSGNGGKA